MDNKLFTLLIVIVVAIATVAVVYFVSQSGQTITGATTIEDLDGEEISKTFNIESSTSSGGDSKGPQK